MALRRRRWLQVLRVLETQTFDLILMDVMARVSVRLQSLRDERLRTPRPRAAQMPTMGGLEATERIRQNRWISQPRYVADVTRSRYPSCGSVHEGRHRWRLWRRIV